MANAGPKCNHRLATSLWMHCRQGTDGFPPPAQPFATHCIGGRNSHYTDTPNTFICYGILSWNTITLLGERYYIYADPYSSWASWKSLGLPAALLWIINQEGQLQQRLNVQCIQLNSDQLPSSRTVVEHAELLGQFIKPQGHPLTIHFETKCCSDVKLFQNNWLQLSTQRVNPDVEPAHEGYLPAGRRARWEMGIDAISICLFQSSRLFKWISTWTVWGPTRPGSATGGRPLAATTPTALAPLAESKAFLSHKTCLKGIPDQRTQWCGLGLHTIQNI